MYEAVKRGDLTGMSFAFTVPAGGDDWQGCIRTIKKIDKVYECSVVAFPAYAEARVEARGTNFTVKQKKLAKIRINKILKRSMR